MYLTKKQIESQDEMRSANNGKINNKVEREQTAIQGKKKGRINSGGVLDNKELNI